MTSGDNRWFRVSLEDAALVVRLRPESVDGLPRQVGEFVQRAVSINGLPTTAQFGALVLTEDGRYRLGRAEGRWSRRGAAIQFEGPIAPWGEAVVTEAGIHFEFLRGPLRYSVEYAHAARPAGEEQRAAR